LAVAADIGCGLRTRSCDCQRINLQRYSHLAILSPLENGWKMPFLMHNRIPPS